MDKLTVEDAIDKLTWELTDSKEHGERVKESLRQFARSIMQASGVAFRERG